MKIIYQTLLAELLWAVSVVVAHRVLEHFEAARRKQGDHDISLFRNSYTSCLDECKARDWCTGISYCRLMTFCIVHGTDAGDKPLLESLGFIYSDRSSWSEQSMTCDDRRCNAWRAGCGGGSSDCTYKDCPLPALTNAYIVLHGNQRTVDAKVSFKCDRNYHLTGPKTVKCMQGQPEPNWNDQFPSCVIEGMTTTTDPITTTTTTSTSTDPTTSTISATTNPTTTTTTTSTTTDPTTATTSTITTSTTTDPTTTTTPTITDPTTTTTSTTTDPTTTTTSTTTDLITTTTSTTTGPTTTTTSTTTGPTTTTTSTTTDPTTTTTSTTTDPTTTTTSTTTDPTTTTTSTTTDPTTTTVPSTTTTTHAVACASDWMSYDNACYYVDDVEGRTFDRAKYYCDGLGAKVLVPDSQSETDFIEGKLLNGRSYSYWIDVQYIYGEWTTGSGANNLSFHNWHIDYPDRCDDSQTCVVLHNSWLYKWICQSCEMQMKTVCELH